MSTIIIQALTGLTAAAGITTGRYLYRRFIQQ